MLRTSIVFFLVLTTQVSHLPAQSWLQASQSDSPFTSHRFYGGQYHAGQLYWWGDLWPDVAFGPFTASIPEGESVADAFLLTLNASDGVPTNLLHLTGQGYERIEDMAPASDGGVWVTGFFSETLEVGGTTLESTGFYDGFVLKTDAAGNVAQAWQFPISYGVINYTGIEQAEDGTLWLIANFSGILQIGGYEYETSSGQSGLLLHLTPSGDVISSHAFLGNSGSEGPSVDFSDLVLLPNGDIVFGGSLTGSVAVDGLPEEDYGSGQAFLCRYSSEGALQWLNTYSGGYSLVNTLDLLPGGGIVAGIQFQNSFVFDSETILGSGAFSDMALFAVDNEGSAIWIESFIELEPAVSSGIYPNSLSATEDGVFIGGSYSGSVSHNDSIILNASHTSGYLLQLSSTGDFQKGYTIESGGFNRVNAIAAAPEGLAYAGEFTGGLSFEGQSVPGINSTLFYGLLSGVVNAASEHQRAKRELLVFPNPATAGACWVEVPGAGLLSLYSANGQLVARQLVQAGSVRLPLRGRSTGWYQISWRSAHHDEVLTTRILHHAD